MADSEPVGPENPPELPEAPMVPAPTQDSFKLAEVKVAEMKGEIHAHTRDPDPTLPGPSPSFASTQKPPEPEVASEAPAASVESLMAEIDDELKPDLRNHLQLISDNGDVTVLEFSEMSGVPREFARKVLDRYVTQGLLADGWRSAAARYSLTDNGKALL